MNFPANLNLYHPRRMQLLRNPAFPAIASALLALFLYAVTLRGTYVYDDVFVVQNDPRVHHPNQWKRLWTSDYFDGGIDNLYRPIVSSTYAIEWWLHGDRPWIFHGVNILLHALAAAAVAEFTRRALGAASVAQAAALCAGLLFAAHPVHAEAVANIVGRAELLCTSLIFAGLILLVRRPITVIRVVLIVTIGILAMLSKEQGVLQPLLWLFFGITLWINPAARERSAMKFLVLITCWIWAGYLIGREHFLRFEWDRTYIDPMLQPLVLSHGFDRVLMPVVLLGHYTALLLWPNHFSADYGGDVIGSVAHASDPYFWMGIFTIILWFSGVLLCLKTFEPQRRRDAEKSHFYFFSSLHLRVSAVQRFILFCLLSLAVTYGIIGNILTLIATNFAERLIYLPSAFLLMIVGTLLALIPLKPRAILLTILLIPASIRTVSAAKDWNTPLVLFEHSLESQPKSVQLRLLLSQLYHQQGNIARANSILRDACRLYPDYWRAWMFRANEDMDDGDLTDADESLKRAMKLKADIALLGATDRLASLQAATRPTGKPSQSIPAP